MDIYVAILIEDQAHRISNPDNNKYIILHYFPFFFFNLTKTHTNVSYFEMNVCRRFDINFLESIDTYSST